MSFDALAPPKETPGQIIPAQRESTAIMVSSALETVLVRGDLKELTPTQRIDYCRAFCQSLGLNLLTRPVEYILFKEYDGGAERLELYIRATGAAQLRKLHRIGIIPGSLRREIRDEHCIVSVDVRDGWGTTDSATGSVTLFKYKKNSSGHSEKVTLIGREWDNAIMKCETKAKRRATLSICGLAMLDESQLDTMQVIGGVTPDGHIYRTPIFEDSQETGKPTVDAAELEKNLAEIKKASDASVLKFIFTCAYEKASELGDRNAMKLLIDARDLRKTELGYAR